MKMRNKLSLASLVAMGLMVSGCSQMGAQQVSDTAVAAPAPEVKTVVDCSQCQAPAPVAKPRPRPRPVAPRPQLKPAPRPVAMPRPAAVDRWAHTHPAIPGCTNSITHSHPYTDRNHTHRYSCRTERPRPVVVQQPPVRVERPVVVQRPQPRPYVAPPAIVMPKVKAKGNYRGPIAIDGGVMKQYQQ